MKYSIKTLKNMISFYKKAGSYYKADQLRHFLKLKIKQQKNGIK